MGGGLRIDGESNFDCRKTLRGLETLKEEGFIQGRRSLIPRRTKGHESCNRDEGVKSDDVGDALNREQSFKVWPNLKMETGCLQQGARKSQDRAERKFDGQIVGTVSNFWKKTMKGR